MVVSLALGGPSVAFTALNSVGTFTTTAHLIVHLSAGSNWGAGPSEARAKTWISEHASRVTINERQLQVQAGTPGVLGAHLSNFEVCEQRRLCNGKNAKFVLMAANVLMLRHGLEQHVAAHSLSFCIHSSSCSDAHLSGDNQLWREKLGELSWDPRSTSSEDFARAVLLRRMRHSVRTSNDSAAVEDGWIARFVELLRSGHLPPTWLARPIAQMPHEGSFYPVRVVRDFLRRGFRGSAFEAALQRQQASGSHPCPCCDLYDTNTSWKSLGSCSFEELLLPTFVWQHHPDLLRAAVPPSVLRVWANLHQPHNVTRVLCHLVAAPSGLGHFFGIKVPHFFLGKMMRDLLRLDPFGASVERDPSWWSRICRES